MKYVWTDEFCIWICLPFSEYHFVSVDNSISVDNSKLQKHYLKPKTLKNFQSCGVCSEREGHRVDRERQFAGIPLLFTFPIFLTIIVSRSSERKH